MHAADRFTKSRDTSGSKKPDRQVLHANSRAGARHSRPAAGTNLALLANRCNLPHVPHKSANHVPDGGCRHLGESCERIFELGGGARARLEIDDSYSGF